MFRSHSPQPSIAQSVQSKAPSAWKDIDPLASVQNLGLGSSQATRSTSQLRPEAASAAPTGAVSTRRSLDDGAGLGIGTFNPVYGWTSFDSSGGSPGEEDAYGSKASKRAKSGSVFSRVFKATESVANASNRNPSRGRSDSTDFLYATDALADVSGSSPSSPAASGSPRATTPPMRPSTAGDSTTSITKPKKKNRRPMSLNMALDLAPPPTSNTLSPETRSELLRKNRKLQQVLGADFVNNPSGGTVHRSSKSEDAGPIGGLVANFGMASLGKKSGSKGLSLSRIAGTPSNDSQHWSPVRSKSESLPSPQGKGVSSSHLLLNQGSTVDDPGLDKKSLSPKSAKKNPLLHASSSKQSKPTHLGSRSRSLSASTALTPIPATPDSFVDFSSDAGELFISNFGGYGPRSTTQSKFAMSPITVSPTAKHDTTHPRHGVDSSPNPFAHPADSPTKESEFKRGPRPASSHPYAAVQHPKEEAQLTSPQTKRLSLASRSSSTPPSTPPLHATFPQTRNMGFHGRSRSFSASSLDTLDANTLDSDAAERKRRRDRLVKLHRFLGSNVPADAVLGHNTTDDADLPPPADGDLEEGDERDKWWKSLKRREGSMEPAETEDDWMKDNEPGEPPMSEHDRTLNVKRKAKMERMFGAAPPQRLYVSRSSSDPNEIVEDGEDTPAATTPGLNSLEFHRHSHSLNSLSYLLEKEDTASLRDLFREIVKEDPVTEMEEDIVFAPPEDLEDEDTDDLVDPKPRPRVALHRKSLLRGKAVAGRSPLSPSFSSSPYAPSPLRRPTLTSSSPSSPTDLAEVATLPDKRASLSSITTLDIENEFMDGFQQRRKRAAKLTKFFGTDYRSLFGEVLESIESGVKDDKARGSLSEAEALELMKKLERLRARKDAIATFPFPM